MRRRDKAGTGLPVSSSAAPASLSGAQCLAGLHAHERMNSCVVGIVAKQTIQQKSVGINHTKSSFIKLISYKSYIIPLSEIEEVVISAASQLALLSA